MICVGVMRVKKSHEAWVTYVIEGDRGGEESLTDSRNFGQVNLLLVTFILFALEWSRWSISIKKLEHRIFSLKYTIVNGYLLQHFMELL